VRSLDLVLEAGAVYRSLSYELDH